MFCIFFGWQKASKCKKMIKRAQRRLKQLKNKRQAIASQLRKDLAELIQNHHQENVIIIKRVELLIQDENLVAAYELLEHFFEFILKQFKYIRRHKDLPSDINEAVSSLIFASSRCGNFPELYAIRKLFEQRYGEKFVTVAVELHPGNLVNNKLKENLSVKPVPDDLKYRVVDEIAKDNCLQPKVNECKGNQLVESGVHTNDTIAGSRVYSSQVQNIEEVTCVNPSILKPSDSYFHQKSPSTDNTLALVSTIQQYPSYYSPLQQQAEKQNFPEPIFSQTSDFQNKGEIKALLPYAEEIEECNYFVSKDNSFQDQRQLLGYDENDIDEDESTKENSVIRSSGKRKGTSKKRLRKRSGLLESQGIMEIGQMRYYQKPSSHYCRTQKKHLLEGIPRKNQHKSSEKENLIQSCENFNLNNMCECSLEHPCYCSVYNDQHGVLHFLGELFHFNLLNHDESNKGMELVTAVPQKQPKHVHPKLPEYDDIVATFTALKREKFLEQQKK